MNVCLSEIIKKYGETVALDNVSLEFSGGSVIGLIGPNGSGKSTLLKVVLTLVQPDAGTVSVDGADLRRVKQSFLERTAYVSSEYENYGYLTGFDNMRIYEEMFENENPAKIAEVAGRLGIEGALHKKVKTYSTGMKKRLDIAKAVLCGHDIILMDEPMNGLDVDGIRILREIIAEERRNGSAVVISSHILSELEKICDRFVFMDKGRIVADMTDTSLFSTLETEYFKIIKGARQ